MAILWMDQWQRLSRRIGGLLSAINVVPGAEQRPSHGIAGHINRQLDATFDEIVAAFDDPGCPREAKDAFVRLKSGYSSLFGKGSAGSEASRLAHLVAFQSEIDYLLADNELRLSALTERAFIHLQRLIVADDSVRNTWKDAFKAGETACERLGGVHLLHHGIWAFKAWAEGERTDLILGGKLTIGDDIRRAFDGLVLTEWKIPKKKVQETWDEAVTQSEIYGQGSLAGFELRSLRYIVTVSNKIHDVLQDQTKGEVTYRHIAICVDPPTPSVASK